MKKALVILLLLVPMIMFAQTYTVLEISGIIMCEDAQLRVGDILRHNSNIRMNIGSRMVVEYRDAHHGGDIFTLNRPDYGSIQDLCYNSRMDRTVQIRGRVHHTDTSAVTRRTAQVGTASARASDAASDLEFEE